MKVLTYFILSLFITLTGETSAQQDFAKENIRMVAEIREMVRDTSEYIGKSKLNDIVLEAILNVLRHEFVPRRLRNHAYENRPLPIGKGQTISQPYIVALMTALADLDENSIILEIGTGSGYQTAILAEIVDQVHTIEIIESLGRQAEKKLTAELGYKNIDVKIDDGYHGWPEHAPFDAILVTAAPEYIPEPLIQQLELGGKLVIPIGKQLSIQSLKVIEKDSSGDIHTKDTLSVGFVPLTRDD